MTFIKHLCARHSIHFPGEKAEAKREEKTFLQSPSELVEEQGFNPRILDPTSDPSTLSHAAFGLT